MKMSELVAKYIQLREQKAQFKAEYDMKTAKIDQLMEKIENKCLEILQQTGTELIRTDAGTIYTSTRTSASVADREAFMEFVKSRDEWPLLEVRPSKSAVEEYRAANEELPPGINWREERIVNIRRSA